MRMALLVEKEPEEHNNSWSWSKTKQFFSNQALRTVPVVLLFGLAFGVSQPVYTELIKDRVRSVSSRNFYLE